MRSVREWGALAGACLLVGLAAVAAAPGSTPGAVVHATDAGALEVLAAREICRYVYLRTGTLLPVVPVAPGAVVPGEPRALFLVGVKSPALVRPLAAQGGDLAAVAGLGPQEYVLRTLSGGGERRCLLVAGGDGPGTLYGAYRLAEHLGVRFYLHGDVVPDARVPLAVPDLNETGRPLFDVRGIQPFHDFPEGPDWWNTDDYLAVVAQLPKLRMNFLGLHTYPEGGVGPEPTVWIGQPQDVGPDGRAEFCYPASWMNTLRGNWGYAARPTSQFTDGAAALFEADGYGSEVMLGHAPVPDTPEACAEVFERATAQLRAAFALARALGVRTCVGTETPLVVPRRVAERVAVPRAAADRAWLTTLGGKTAHYRNPIAGTADDPLYQSVRWDLRGYRLQVPNGRYTVTLKFCEVAYTGPGARVFGVTLQGRPVLERLDICAEAGPNAALDKRFDGVEVTDGSLSVGFVPVVEYPCIAALAVEGPGFNGRVNCGGPAHAGYVADDDGGPALGPEQMRALYEGLFARAAKAYPLDYYWLWTPEGWTWQGASDEEVAATAADLSAAVAAAQAVRAPFQLATCGWVLGPPSDRSLFHRLLPAGAPMSCINRQVGKAPVEPAFAGVRGRPTWAIPWLEDDPNLLAVQLWAGRMRKDAVDARAYGCTGLLGIHWRTRVMGPNVAALAQAAWEQGDWARPAPVPRVEGPLGGRHARFDDHAIAGTSDPVPYRSVRYDMAGYRLQVPDGRYTVTLRFCEPHYREVGKRVFGVRVQGRPLVEHLDIFARVGGDRALDVPVADVDVQGGWLDVDFDYEVEYPSLAALEVEGNAVHRRINCGGPAHGDYAADWPAAAGGGGPARFLATDDFYADWALAQFGPEVAAAAGAVFARIDSRLPEPSGWIDGPGGLAPSEAPLADVAPAYAFIGELEALRPRVAGAGSRERFDYWLESFRAMLVMERVKCAWGALNRAVKALVAEQDPARRRTLAETTAVPARRELVQAAAELSQRLLGTVGSPGELGTVANWQQHALPRVVAAGVREIAEALGQPLPADLQPSQEYRGPDRVIVPTVRGSLAPGEPLRLRVILLGQAAWRDARLCWRPLGRAEFATVPLTPVARGVHRVELPAQTAATVGVEYYVEATGGSGQAVRFPATAPDVGQTVVILPAAGVAAAAR